MKTILFFGFYFSFFLTACSQNDTAAGFRSKVTNYELTVGRSTIRLQQFNFETDAPFLLFQVHGNETTAAEAACRLAHQQGIQFLQLLNKQERLVEFALEGKTIQFDPNRIFSDTGIKKTLRLSGHYSDAAFTEVKRFSDSLLSLLQQDKPIVAVHNNTDARFNILQYRDGGLGQVHVNADLDADDFFITNDEEIFHLLKEENLNVVLEDASQLEEDGSLSLYCGRNNIRYINVEAEHGHLEEQLAMLHTVYRILK